MRFKALPWEYVYQGLGLYFLGLSFRNTSKSLTQFVKRSHVAVESEFKDIYQRKLPIRRKEYRIYNGWKSPQDCPYIYVFFGRVEPENKQILAVTKSQERKMHITERFIPGLVKIHGNHVVSTDAGTWCPQACKFLN